MLKESIKRKLTISFLTLIVLLLIYLVPSENKDEKILFEPITENIVYLLNNDLLVQTKIVGNNDNIDTMIKDIIDSLTVNGTKKYYLKNGYKAILPSNTTLLDYSLQDGLLKLNFSKEYNNLSSNLQEKAIEALVYSLTEIDGIDGIMIFVEGTKLERINAKVLPNVLTRDYGINKVYEINTFNDVNKATIYYYFNDGIDLCLVPVTIFTNDDINKVEVIIEELKSAPIYYTNLMSFLADNAKVLDYEMQENIIKINFSNYLLDSFFDDSLIEEVKYAISYSLKDSLGIKEVNYFVDNKAI